MAPPTPPSARAVEKYEVATVTAVGKPGTQAYLGADAPAGATNIKVTSVANISAGDKIRLDIDSVGHGIETVTVTKVGTQSSRGALSADASAGATSIKVQVRGPNGFHGGRQDDRRHPREPGNRHHHRGRRSGSGGISVDFTPALAKAHADREFVVAQGTGLDLAAPLKFNHAANLPFSARGTGISFKPETAFAHSSNEPVQPLGTGITLDSPLAKDHAIDAVVRDAAVTTAGYQGTPAPNQWFGGPALSPRAGSMVLRDAAGLVVDSLNYGGLVDPWAAEGYQAASGAGRAAAACLRPARAAAASAAVRAAVSDTTPERGPLPGRRGHRQQLHRFPVAARHHPVGRVGRRRDQYQSRQRGGLCRRPDDHDRYRREPRDRRHRDGRHGGRHHGERRHRRRRDRRSRSPAGLASAPARPSPSTAARTRRRRWSPIRQVPAAGAAAGRGGGATITVAAPLKFAHAAGAQVSGTGITLTTALNQAHTGGAQVAGNAPTPGAPNRYSRRGR